MNTRTRATRLPMRHSSKGACLSVLALTAVCSIWTSACTVEATVPTSPTVPVAPTPPPDDYGDSQATAFRIRVNSSWNGVLEDPSDLDFFRFDVPFLAADLIVETTGNTDTVGTLFFPDGSSLASDDTQLGRNFRIVVPLPPGGTYFVAVEGYCGIPCATGPYVLHVSSR